MKRIVCACFAVLMVLTLCIPCFAAEVPNYDTSVVTDDLKDYNLTNYLPNVKDTGIYLIDFFEYGYSESSGIKTPGYGLYVYLYNPSGKTLKDGSLNKIQMATKWSSDNQGNLSASQYANVGIRILNMTTDRTLVKCKVSTPGSVVLEKNGVRRYDVSGIDLFDGTTSNAKTYAVGHTFQISGYLEGFAKDTKKKSTYSCTRTDFKTLEIECRQTSYLTGDSARGAGYSNQINSVYFSVPNTFEKQYGKLYSINYEFTKYRTAPMLVVDNAETYQAFLEVVGEPSDDSWSFGVFTYVLRHLQHSSLCDVKRYFGKKDSPNIDIGSLKNVPVYYGPSAEKLPYLSTVFCVDDVTATDKILVSAGTIQKYFENYGKKTTHTGTVKNGTMSLDLFQPLYYRDSDSLPTYGEYVNNTVDINGSFSLASFADAHTILEGMAEYGFFYLFEQDEFDKSIQNEKFIRKVLKSDFYNRPETVSSNLLVCQDNVAEIRQAYETAASKDESLYLLRYAASDDYFTEHVEFCGLEGNGLFVEENVYLDFKVIYMTFGNDPEKQTVIPCVNTPSDGYTGIVNTTPEDNAPTLSDVLGEKKNWTWLYKLIGVVLIVVAVPVVIDLFDNLNKTLSRKRR